MRRPSATRRAAVAGYGIACAGLARDHMESQLAAFLINDSGFGLEDFRTSGLDAYDLDVIERIFANELAAAEQRSNV